MENNFENMSMERRGSEPTVEQSITLVKHGYKSEMLDKLNELRKENCLTDAVLIAGYEEFPCHRNILAVSSPYFRAMFSGDLRESRLSNITINEVTPWTLRRIVEFAYSGILEINVDNAQDMLAAGSLFQYPDIIDACCDFLSKHLHPSNCLGIEHFAHLHSCEKLEAEAHQHALDNFSIVVDHDEFLELPLQRLLTYFASDLIDVRNEECVYNAGMRWIHHDMEKRQYSLPQILNHVRLATINVEYLSDVIHVDPVIQQCKVCSSLVEEALQYHETKTEQHGQRRQSMQSETSTPRPSTVAREVVVVVGGITHSDSPTQTVEMYDSAKDKWYQLPDMPQSILWFSVAAINNDIYVTGGIFGKTTSILSTMWKFEGAKRKWTKERPMLTPRARHTSAACENQIFVLGGINLMKSDDTKVCDLESIECYNLETTEWTKVGECSFPRKMSKLVPFKQMLVEIGGSKRDYVEDTMETFLLNGSHVINSGEQFRLPAHIQFAQIILLDNVFYIIWEDTKKMIMLNPSKRTFRNLAPMKHTHIHGGAAVLNGKIYVTGGLIDSVPSNIVECYDPDTDTWTLTKSLPQSRACAGCVTIQMC